jgi:hypothetical protein
VESGFVQQLLLLPAVPVKKLTEQKYALIIHSTFLLDQKSYKKIKTERSFHRTRFVGYFKLHSLTPLPAPRRSVMPPRKNIFL